MKEGQTAGNGTSNPPEHLSRAAAKPQYSAVASPRLAFSLLLLAMLMKAAAARHNLLCQQRN